MELIKKESVIICYKNIDELPVEYKELLLAAKNATKTSYAPYSKFNVGCALRLKNNVIISGSNQENIAYPSGLCAERVAIFYAGSQYPDIAITHMAITAEAKDFDINKPVMSCGACLQSISEYEVRFKQPITMILQGQQGDIYVAEGTKTFMPFQFFVDELKNK
ncbi:MAG: cytidine deaminase [Bacteroidia bacterium]